MAKGQWVTVPANLTQSGKPERRYQMKSGQYRTTEPGSAEWYDEMYVKPASNAIGGVREFLGGLPIVKGAMNADPTPKTQQKGPTSFADALVGTPFVLNGVLGFKNQDGKFQARGDMEGPVDGLTIDESSLPSQENPPAPPRNILSDDANARDSAYQAMKQQYAPQADIWGTDEGKAILAAAQSNQYGGEAAGLADYYSNQQKAGIGAMPEIIDAMGYTGDMAKWAEANPALAMREYNKKFANSYEGTGPDNAAIQQAMDQGKYFPSEGSPNPLGETGVATDMNMAQFAETQPVAMQATGNTPFFTDSTGIPGLGGKDLYNKYALMLGNK